MSCNDGLPNDDIRIYFADGKSILADRNTLITRCVFFRNMLDPKFNGSENDIYITDFDSETVRDLIQYLLHDELYITKSTNVAQLLVLCDLMCLRLVHLKICQTFDSVLCDRNCFEILEFTLQRNHQELTTQCWMYIFNKFPNLTNLHKKYDWSYNSLKMTLANDHIRFIKISRLVKYFKYWSIVRKKRWDLLQRVIRDILKTHKPIRKNILEILEILTNLYDINSSSKFCKETQKLNLFVIGGHLGEAEDFFNDNFIPHNEFHEHIQLGYSIRKSIPNSKKHRVFCASALNKNGLYVIGGRNKYGDILDSIEYYDFDMNTWTEAFTMNEPKMLCSAVCIEDNLYVSGGCDVNRKCLKSVYIYLANKRIWKRIADMNYCRTGHKMCSIFGTIYVIGGLGLDRIILNSVEYYDAAANIWIPVCPMLHPRCRFAVAVVKQYTFVFGGIDAEGNTIGNIEKYDTATDSWSCVATIQGIYDMGVSVYNRNVYLCGGNTNNGPTNLIQVFHSESSVFRIIGQLKIKRSGAFICVLPDNELFFNKFTHNCDTLKYIENVNAKLWRYPGIKRNLEQSNENQQIIFEDDFSLR